tara:strand:- start:14520 stop:15287 length:768 start_codon:yes stop_codon:yes gene_type:complete
MDKRSGQPLISIITVSFNSSKTIQDTFDSIGSQSYERIEYIVVDGNSSDGTKDIIEENLKIISKKVSEPDKGIYDAMNKGISMCSGEIIGILNSDDVYSNNKVISEVVNAFTLTNTDLVYGNIDYVSEDLKRIIRKWRSSPFKKKAFTKGWHPPHPAFFVKRKVYEEIGTYDLALNIAADFEFMYRAIEIHSYKSFFINKVLTKMRVGGESNRSIKNILKGNSQVRKSFLKHGVYVNSVIYTIRRLIPKILEYFK